MVEKLVYGVLMNLLIDVGNSRAKFVYENEGVLGEIFYIDLNLIDSAYIKQNWSAVEKLIIASVGDVEITRRILGLAKEKDIQTKLVVSEKERFSVTTAYALPEQLGVDRWLALIGAKVLYPEKTCLIVDLGTATTIDLITAQGQHIGGWIFPGIGTMHSSLQFNTANIKGHTDNLRVIAFGTSTIENVNNGCLAATVGAIEMALLKAKQQDIEINHIVLTGGNAHYIKEHLNFTVELVEELVFKGLQCYLKVM